jgi:single-stranded DNA-binding protein
MNTIHICGNIGAEPEFRLFESGKRKVNFSVALNQYTRDGLPLDTIWIPCQAWDAFYDRLLKCQQRARLSGRKIKIVGTFTQNKWTDQSTGKRNCKLIVNVQSFELFNGLQESLPASKTEAEVIFDGRPVQSRYRRKGTFSYKSKELRAKQDDASI